MNRRRQNTIALWAFLLLPAVWLALIAATQYRDGMNLVELTAAVLPALNRPFAISWTRYSPRFLLIAVLLHTAVTVIAVSMRENRRPGEEHGSAKWGQPKALGRKYGDARGEIILTKNVRMGLDSRRHRRNLNVLVVGGSGAGKTRFFAKPNIMQANTSYLITDPKGELVRSVAPLLIDEGYDVRVFDLIETERSNLYNPFRYIMDDKDAIKLVNTLIKNTTPKGASQNDPFWEKSEIALDTALILYLIHEAPPEEQNFETLMYMIENGAAREEDDDFQSPLDLLFEALEEEEPEHIAVRQYKIFKQAAGDICSKRLVNSLIFR